MTDARSLHCASHRRPNILRRQLKRSTDQTIEIGWESSMSPLSETGLYPIPTARAIKRVAILFAGGPAPAANAVISTAAASFRRNGIEVIGIMHGYAHLIDYRDDQPDERRARLHRSRPEQPAADAEHARHPDRDVADQPRQGRVAARSPGRSRAHGPAPHGASGACLAGRERPGLDRRRRHAQDRQQVQAVPGLFARGRAADRRGSRPQDDRQRLPGHRLHLRLFHRRRDPGLRDPQSAGRRRGGPDVFPGRNHGPQRGLAGLWRGHRRRGQPGPLRRRPHRRPDDRGNRDRPQDQRDEQASDHADRQDRRSDRHA